MSLLVAVGSLPDDVLLPINGSFFYSVVPGIGGSLSYFVVLTVDSSLELIGILRICSSLIGPDMLLSGGSNFTLFLQADLLPFYDMFDFDGSIYIVVLLLTIVSISESILLG